MSIIMLWKVTVFFLGKELYESILTLAKLWLILYVTPLLSLIRYEMNMNFVWIWILYEMTYIKIFSYVFSYNFLSNKILLKSKS